MKKLTVKLKQHTPLIHFQHEQYGATLRASEVKPKLDRFILEKLGREKGYTAGEMEAKKNGWLVGKGEHPALDYKIKIISKEKAADIRLENIEREDGQWTTEEFPLLLANMGGRDTVDELMNFSMYKYVIVQLLCGKDKLYNELVKQFPYFIANTNFGQRSNKGFGSFSVEYINDCNKGNKEIKCMGCDPYYIAKDMLYMDFCLEKKVCDRVIYHFENQKIIFKVIENYWKRLRKKINEDTSVRCVKIDSVEAYIKGMTFVELDDDHVERLPAPIMFKPISYIDGENLNVSVYIMPDTGFLERLHSQYGHNSIIINRNELSLDIIDLDYIDAFSEGLLHDKFGHLRMYIEDKKVDIVFCGQ